MPCPPCARYSWMVVALFLNTLLLPSPSGTECYAANRPMGGIYRIPRSSQNGTEIWIVDGAKVRQEIYPEFLYGGNGQRYLFIPDREIWIDHAIAAEEFGYTLAHELCERDLMARKGLTYAAAHDSALQLERQMRLADQEAAQKHEQELHPVPSTDSEGEKELVSLPDSLVLRNIYRVPLGTRSGVAIWIVDGAAVRRDIYPDFGLSGNDLAYHFIPGNELWIDGQISCEETEFSIAAELHERDLMAEGRSYDDAYEQAIHFVASLRRKATDASRHKPPVRLPRRLDRDVGTGDEGSVK
jgi:hypothetical protein